MALVVFEPPRTGVDPALGPALRSLLEARGIGQESLAHTAGLSVATYAASNAAQSTQHGPPSAASSKRSTYRRPTSARQSMPGFPHATVAHQRAAVRRLAASRQRAAGEPHRLHAEVDPLPFALGGYGGQVGYRAAALPRLRFALAMVVAVLIGGAYACGDDDLQAARDRVEQTRQDIEQRLDRAREEFKERRRRFGERIGEVFD